MKMKNVWMAFSGLIAGSAVGVLVAPAKGKLTREKIQSKGKSILDSAKKEIEKVTTFGNNHEKETQFDHLDNLRSINKHLM